MDAAAKYTVRIMKAKLDFPDFLASFLTSYFTSSIEQLQPEYPFYNVQLLLPSKFCNYFCNIEYYAQTS